MKAKSLVKLPSEMIEIFHVKLQEKMTSKYKDDPANLKTDSMGKDPYFETVECADAYEDYYYDGTPDPSGHVIILLNVLIKFWNMNGREAVFGVDTKTLMRKTCMSESSLRNARNELVERGVCAYIPGTKSRPGFYQLANFRYYYIVGFSEMKPFTVDPDAYRTAKSRHEKSQKKSALSKAYARLMGKDKEDTNVCNGQILNDDVIGQTPDSTEIFSKNRIEMSSKAVENIEDIKNIPVYQEGEKIKNPVSVTGKTGSSINRYRENYTESICPDFKKSEQIQEEDRACDDATLASLSQDIFDSLQDKWSATFPGSHIHSSCRRMKRLQNLIEEFGADRVREVIRKVFASSFLMGKVELDNGGRFKLKVDFILRRCHFVEILDGHYDDATYRTRPTCENINKGGLAYEGYSKKSSVRDEQYEDILQDDYDYFYGIGEYAEDGEEGINPICEKLDNNDLPCEDHSKKTSVRDEQYEEIMQDDYDYVYGLRDYAEDDEEGINPACEEINSKNTSKPVTTNGAAVPEIASNTVVETTPEPVVDVCDMSDEDWFYSLGWALS